MKRILSMVLIVTLLFTVAQPLTAEAATNSGWTYIYTAQQLYDIRNNLSGKYKLMRDIDLAGFEWTPIGTEMAPFKGVLDGNGFVISNLNAVLFRAC